MSAVLTPPTPGFRKALMINFASSSGGALTRLLLAMLLARLLAPAELGQFAIALVLVNIAQVFSDPGVSTWLQREAELTPRKIRSALGLLCAAAWTMGLLLLGLSGPLGRSFGGVEPLLQVLALGFALMPFNVLTAALLQRELAAAKLAYVARIGTLIYAVMALMLAWLGAGAMSLVWAQLANVAACCLVGLNLYRTWPLFAGWRAILPFGLATLTRNLLTALNNALPDLLLGKLGGAAQVGLAGRANASVGLFSTLAGTASNFGSVRWLAEAHQRQAPLAPRLSRATALLTGAGWPILALTALLGREIVLLLFGERWLACVAAIPALAALAALSLLFNYSAAAFAATGRPGLAAWPVATTALARLILMLTFFDGSLASFAALMLAAGLLALPLQLYLHARHLGHRAWAGQGRSFIVTLAVALAAGLTPWLAPIAWWLALRLTRHPLADELQELLRLRSTIRK